jgi:hypothetical protein
MVEGEAAGEGEAPVWSGNEGARGHGDEGGAGVAGLDFEAMPESGGDLPEFAFGDEVEIEKDEGEVSIAEEEVGALEGLLGFGTAEPDEVAAFFVAVGGGVEGIAAIDEGERGRSRFSSRSSEITREAPAEWWGEMISLRWPGENLRGAWGRISSGMGAR